VRRRQTSGIVVVADTALVALVTLLAGAPELRTYLGPEQKHLRCVGMRALLNTHLGWVGVGVGGPL
jgi:hypothetical protein